MHESPSLLDAAFAQVDAQIERVRQRLPAEKRDQPYVPPAPAKEGRGHTGEAREGAPLWLCYVGFGIGLTAYALPC